MNKVCRSIKSHIEKDSFDNSMEKREEKDPVWIVIRCLIQPSVKSTLYYSIYVLWIHTTTATTFNLCYVSVDRFIAIRFPFRYQDFVTKKRCYMVIILVWLISLCLPFTTIPLMFLGNIVNAVLWLSLAFVTFVAPLFVVTFCYVFMFKAPTEITFHGMVL